MKRLPMSFVARCPKCGREIKARTVIGLRLAAREHTAAKHAEPTRAAAPRNGELFGDSGVA